MPAATVLALCPLALQMDVAESGGTVYAWQTVAGNPGMTEDAPDEDEDEVDDDEDEEDDEDDEDDDAKGDEGDDDDRPDPREDDE